MSLAISAIEGTDLFAGAPDQPAQIIRVRVTAANVDELTDLVVEVAGDGLHQMFQRPDGSGVVIAPLHGPEPAESNSAATTVVVEVGVVTAAPVGTDSAVRVAVRSATGETRAEGVFRVCEPGWTMYMVSHFHYDPVWWNTQAAYTSPWDLLAADGTTRRLWEGNGFALVDAHLELAKRDPDYCFVLAEIDYLKPYFDTNPERLSELRSMMAAGRVELLGGTYNEPNTNLTGAETTIRNLVYGVGYQRDILRGDPQTAWQLDVFGHDPQFPGYLDDAGLTGSAWAWGPFHQWGPIQRNHGEAIDDATVMQFPSEFEWIAPSGRGVLTHYMPNHYSAGWWMHASADLAEAESAVYRLYQHIKPVAATKNLLLPVGTDYSPPNRWVTDVQRSWNSRYLWPRFVCGTPRQFLDAVRAELAQRDVRPSPQSRDMNPIYTGKDVSYIDTKQAQRAGEVAATDAEKLATAAVLLGAGLYPDAALDKVWRLLAYGAHHDAITGSESDQVYLDLLQGWREAFDLADEIRTISLSRLAERVDTASVADERALAVIVTNTLSFSRTDLVEVRIDSARSRAGLPVLWDDTGAQTPFELLASDNHGMLIRFLATGVPGVGWRTWRLEFPNTAGHVADPELQPAAAANANAAPAAASAAAGQSHTARHHSAWTRDTTGPEANTIANEYFSVTVDPQRGGGIVSIVDLTSGVELLADGALGNELRIYDEYPAHPQMGEGPWHLLPKGPVVGSSAAPASVTRWTGVLGEKLVIVGTLDGTAIEQHITVHRGLNRVVFRTRILDFGGSDRLIRARFPLQNRGQLPVSEVAAAVVGRGFALPDVDSEVAPWTLDNPANTWFGLSTAARVELSDPDGKTLGTRAFGVAEIVVEEQDTAAETARELVVALAKSGVTATTSTAAGSRYGWLHVDSNLPDIRFLIGGPAENSLTAELLNRVGPDISAELARQLETSGTAVIFVPAERTLHDVWVPNADLRDVRALAAVIIAGSTPGLQAEAISRICRDLAEFRICAVSADADSAEIVDAAAYSDRTAALITFGLPGFAVDPTGALHLSLMRSTTGWPSGIWLDPPRRTVPDGSGFQLQHWTHEFDYALVAGAGDWRVNNLAAAGLEFNTPLLSRAEPAHPGDLPATLALLTVQPERTALLSTLKSAGNPIATGQSRPAEPTKAVTVRLTESTGHAVRATISGLLAPEWLIATNLLEAPLPEATWLCAAADGATDVELDGFQVKTLRGESPGRAAAHADSSGALAVLGATKEIARPIFTRYWLHNRGPAPLGFLPISVSLDRALERVVGGRVTAEVIVSSQLTDRAIDGIITISGPTGWTYEPSQRIFAVQPEGFVRFPFTVTVPGDEPDGVYFVSAAYESEVGAIEDILTVVVGEGTSFVPSGVETTAPEYGQGAPPEDSGGPTGLEVAVVTPQLTLAAGERSELRLQLRNRTQSQIRGEIALVSPWGTWDLIQDVLQGFSVDAGEAIDVRFAVDARAHHPGLGSWALAKVMWFGRVQYSETVPITVQARP